ncbi:MAG TPA: hypothetical protein VFQ35_03930, partial [Polyangiaceae bacterium]|nr:hypothetical protein [Polyangiaceae bacterium]
TLKKVEGAKSIKDSPIDAVIVNLHESEGAPKVEWLVGRSGALVAGVGDEAFVAAKSGGAKATFSDQDRLTLLRSVLSGSKSPASPAASGSAAP